MCRGEHVRDVGLHAQKHGWAHDVDGGPDKEKSS